VKVVVDVDLCSGHAQCESAAPEVFRVNDDAIVELLIEFPDESLRPKVQDAAQLCPERVITIED
jgi:ferredoxin